MTWVHITGILVLVFGTIGVAWYIESRARKTRSGQDE